MKRDVWAYAGMAVVAVAAAVISFDSLMGLARLAGIVPPWLLPLAIDAYAVTATRMWMTGTVSARVRRYACCNAFAAIAVSVAGNAAYHGFTAAGVHRLGSDRWPVAVAVAAVAPIMLGLVAHLHSLLSTDRTNSPTPTPQTMPVVPSAEPSRPVPPDTPPRRPHPTPAAPTRVGTRSVEMRDHIRSLIAAGQPVVAAEVDRRFGTNGYAKKIVAQVKAESNGHTPTGAPT